MYWRLNRVIFPVYNLGSGRRIAIWVQGCSIGCKGCINPELWNEHTGKSVDIASFAAGLLKLSGNFDGITITGGEPFDQYEALIAFCTFVKMNSNTHIFVYSGYNLNQLKQKFPDLLFTHCINQLLDGPFVGSLHENKNTRGSSNQNLYRFDPATSTTQTQTEREIKITKEELAEAGKKWSLKVDDDKQVYMSGIPKPDDFHRLAEQLNQTGIKIEFS